MEFNDMENFALGSLLSHNKNFMFTMDTVSEDEQSPTSGLLPNVQQKPISKRRGKKRSSRACASCRARKVRCNIVAHGAPCSNCRHDEVDCILPLSRRQRAARERAEQQNEILKEQDILSTKSGDIRENNICDRQSPSYQHDITVATQCQKILPQLSPPHGMAMTDHVLCEILPGHSASQRNSPVLAAQVPPGLLNTAKRKTKMSERYVETPLATSIYSCSSKLSKPFMSLPGHLTTTDISYLVARSAFDLPSEALQVVLLRAFVDFVLPSLPILDIDEVLEVIKTGKGKKISLLLYQAIMISAVEHVSARVIKTEYGSMSKSDVIAQMSDKVKLLYDFDTTTDRLTVIQSLLLLSHALSSSPKECNVQTHHKDSHHYLGLAISLSLSLGLHRTGPTLPSISLSHPKLTSTISSFQASAIRRKRLEKRIWWVLCLQDRLLHIKQHGKSRIHSEDHDVAMLEMEDFDIADDDMGEEDDEREGYFQRLQRRNFIEKVRLYEWAVRARRARRSLDEDSVIYDSAVLWHSGGKGALYMSDGTIPNVRHRTRAHSFAGSNSTSEELESEKDVDCATPQDGHFFSIGNAVIDSLQPRRYLDVGEEGCCQIEDRGDVKLGVGVEGEYDDYLEYLRV